VADDSRRIAVCDLDGTLVDSDRALIDAFVAHGVPRDEVSFGHVLADECDRLGITVESYLAAYDETAVVPFPGVDDLVARLGRWAVCSNKHPDSGRAELDRLGWRPEIALFSDAFDGPKRLGPVLDILGLTADDIAFVGDTAHDRACAVQVGCPFILAGWNRRAAASPEDLVAARPIDVLALLDR
jgi:HAD superfamily hydrolase (TIGR01549 family)